MAKRRFLEGTYRKEPWFRALCAAFLSCESEDEAADFLRDVATLSELQALSERLEVAKQLSQGIPYRDIARNTGASTTTVTRVAGFLENGCGGYRRFLNAHRHHRIAPHVVHSHHHAEKPSFAHGAMEGKREQRPVSVLQKYLDKKK